MGEGGGEGDSEGFESFHSFRGVGGILSEFPIGFGLFSLGN